MHLYFHLASQNMDAEFDFSDSFRHKKTPEEDEDDKIDYAEIERTEETEADPSTIKERIDNALEILASFSQRRDKSKSRNDIIRNLSR